MMARANSIASSGLPAAGHSGEQRAAKGGTEPVAQQVV